MRSDKTTLPQNRITATEILDRVPITTIMATLGFSLPKRGNHARCTLHGGDSLSFSFHEGKGTWYCHRCNEGGGKIHLVKRALGCDSRTALQWVADLAGIPLDAPWTALQRQEHAARFEQAKPEALDLIDWKRSLLDALRVKRAFYQDTYHAAKRYLFAHPATDGEFKTECAWEVQFTYWQKVEWLDTQIEKVENASYPELLPLFRESRRGALAA